MSYQVAVILQARTESSRLPRKVLKDLSGRPMLAFLVERLKRAQSVDEIILATTDQPADNILADLGTSLGLSVVRGSLQDVLSRFALAASSTKAQTFVRITADCPFIDPILLDEIISEFHQKDVDYFGNCMPPTFPDGLDISVFTRDALLKASQECVDPYQREHVTPWIRESGQFLVANRTNTQDISHLRWTVDEPEDLEVIRNVVLHFKGSSDFSWQQVLKLHEEQPELFSANLKFSRNEGSKMSEGQKLWRRAKRVIPGGNMLLSKRAECFLPGKWPAYFSKAKGCKVWDLDDNEYIDMSIMGIGTNTLGYGHPEVDEAVARTVHAGNMSTFNCPEEVHLAEKLIELHPWADMVRFARSGGEANAIAVRIARAASGRDKVAICGYHGWHDWYLSANLSDEKGLDGHLLPGLEPNGVPRSLQGTVFPFRYNDFDELNALVDANDIGVIKMEVFRNIQPVDGFLHKVRQLATDKNIVLIFDECTSGFRETFGGLHLKYGVEPDMAMFGKALGNGYAITAVIGRQDIMQAAQSTFISSTFWTERIGPSAALTTLQVMEREKSWESITRTGYKITGIWATLAKKHRLQIEIFGLPALIKMRFVSESNLAYKTLITQEMLKLGYLAGNSVYVCTEHSEEIVEGYAAALDSVFALISECEQGRPVEDLLEGELCHAEFRRLN